MPGGSKCFWDANRNTVVRVDANGKSEEAHKLEKTESGFLQGVFADSTQWVTDVPNIWLDLKSQKSAQAAAQEEKKRQAKENKAKKTPKAKAKAKPKTKAKAKPKTKAKAKAKSEPGRTAATSTPFIEAKAQEKSSCALVVAHPPSKFGLTRRENAQLDEAHEEALQQELSKGLDEAEAREKAAGVRQNMKRKWQEDKAARHAEKRRMAAETA